MSLPNTKKRWYHFRPRTRGQLDDPTVYQPESLYARARQIIDDSLRQTKPRLGRRADVYQQTAEAVRSLASHDSHEAVYLLAALILQAPNAARAQREMDEHHGGYRNREARLYELIDFNDTFVDTVLSLASDMLPEFNERLRVELNRFCSQLHVAGFSDQQFEAITHGLSREIAVYCAARSVGYIAHMTSRAQDAMGIDMIITDPETKKSINIDVKTHSAFHFRLIELEHQHRMDENKRYHCELAGYCVVQNGHGDQAVETVLVRVATEILGEIRDFNFVDTSPIATLLASALRDHGRHMRGY